MEIGPGKAVTIAYTLRDDAGAVLDVVEQEDPISFLSGSGQMPDGLEKALTGRTAGERVEASLSMAEAFGPRDESLVQTIPVRQLQVEDKSAIEVGGVYRAWLADGAHDVFVTERRGSEVVIDGNHPFAGKNLRFIVDVVDVRDATPAELSHGHIHGDGDHE